RARALVGGAEGARLGAGGRRGQRARGRYAVWASSPSGLGRQPQDVADAALGVDQRGEAIGVDLASQVGDVGLDDAGLTAEVVVPDVVEDLGLGQDPVRVEHEVAQQLELGRRHLDDAAAAPDLVGVVVELEIVEGERRGARLVATGTAQYRADTGDDLLEAERLGDVVVATHGQALDLVVDPVTRRDEDDGQVPAGLAQPPGDLEPVHVGEHDVEDDEVGVALGRADDGRAAVV